MFIVASLCKMLYVNMEYVNTHSTKRVRAKARGPKGTELGQFTRCNFVLETESQKIKFEQ